MFKPIENWHLLLNYVDKQALIDIPISLLSICFCLQL
jgi:hypothetical protein